MIAGGAESDADKRLADDPDLARGTRVVRPSRPLDDDLRLLPILDAVRLRDGSQACTFRHLG